jgi:hypothetical protein
MLLQGKKILSTAKTPEIILTHEGVIRIKGRWMMENSAGFSQVLSDWYDNYIFDLPEIYAIDIYLEYFSGVNFFVLISLLRKILCAKLIRRELPINWYYEEGDDDILDLGEYISSYLGTTFNYIVITDKKDLISFSDAQTRKAI